VEASPWTNWEIRAGYAFEPSPFTKLGSGNNLILDNDRHRATLGLGYEVHPSFLRAPVSFDAVLMYFQLAPREHRTQDQQVLWSEGYLVGGGASVTIRY